MKDDYGREWKKQDYWMALFCICAILFVIIFIPFLWLSGTVLTAYVFNWNLDKVWIPSAIIALCVWFVGMSIWTIKSNKKLRKFNCQLLPPKS